MSLVALSVSPDGPVGVAPEMMTWAAVAGGLAGASLWVRRWPTRAQSVVFTLDSLGHVAGDRALVEVARVLRENTRDSAR